jgi:hypothetical protein
MDINIRDVHYQKYIKYKKKYLELKQSGGSGMMSIFDKSKVQPAPTSEEQLYDTDYLNLIIPKFSKSYEHDNVIFLTHATLIIDILPNLYNKITDKECRDNIINIYIDFCNNINKNIEYFENNTNGVINQTEEAKINARQFNIDDGNKVLERLIAIQTKIKIQLPLLIKLIRLYYLHFSDHIGYNVVLKVNNNICNINEINIDSYEPMKHLETKDKELFKQFLSAFNKYKKNNI